MCKHICALVLICAALTTADPEKRAEMSPMPFILGSRYGRSPSPPRVMSPRNDRFFLGSRYGKRSGVPGALSPHPVFSSPILCEFTGIYSLYRCTPNAATRTLLEMRRGQERSGDED